MDEEQARGLVHGMGHDVMESMLDRYDDVRAILALGDALYDDLVASGVGGVSAASAVATLLTGRMMTRMAGGEPLEREN